MQTIPWEDFGKVDIRLWKDAVDLEKNSAILIGIIIR
jgi:hypothetical protein